VTAGRGDVSGPDACGSRHRHDAKNALRPANGGRPGSLPRSISDGKGSRRVEPRLSRGHGSHQSGFRPNAPARGGGRILKRVRQHVAAAEVVGPLGPGAFAMQYDRKSGRFGPAPDVPGTVTMGAAGGQMLRSARRGGISYQDRREQKCWRSRPRSTPNTIVWRMRVRGDQVEEAVPAQKAAALRGEVVPFSGITSRRSMPEGFAGCRGKKKTECGLPQLRRQPVRTPPLSGPLSSSVLSADSRLLAQLERSTS